MTEKLYYKDSHQKVFEAKVLSCNIFGDRYRVILDQTAFFPEGGGQKADTGILGTVSVLDVQEVEGEIHHYLDAPLQEGKYYTGTIDWDKRFSRMQNHSGEHIVSGIVHDLYGYDNVGFHMSDEVITIDFNGALTHEQLSDIEYKANKVIWDNELIETWFPSEIEAENLDFRSKKEIVGAVRLVKIGNIDLCACCAPHVSNTGEIGAIKILSSMSHRGGVRIEMIAGDLAYFRSCHDFNQVREISQMLSVKQAEIVSGVQRQAQQIEDLKQERYLLCQEMMEIKVRQYEELSSDNICEFNSSLSDQMCREFVNRLVKKTDGIVAIFTGSDEIGYHYIIGSNNKDLRELAPEINKELNGKGGGSPSMIQGNVSCDRSAIKKCILSK